MGYMGVFLFGSGEIETLNEFERHSKANRIKNKDISYAITTCEGMDCNPDNGTWLSVVKGNKKVAGSGYCDAGTSSGFENLPLVSDKNGVYHVLKKSDAISNYFSIKKNPL